MEPNHPTVGSRLENTALGAGTVTFVGSEHIGVAFDDGTEALIRREALATEAADPVSQVQPSQDGLPWPQSTFVAESGGARHFLGSHWDPFVEDSKEIMVQLPQIVPEAMVQTGYGADRPPARQAPADWPKGFELVWPLREQGLALILRPEPAANLIVSLFPFFAQGSQQTLRLRSVLVWEGGLEAQITAVWGEGEVTFFDTQYLINRAWYEAGMLYDFLLSGVAYSAGLAQPREWTIQRHPDQVAWMNLRLKPDEPVHEAACTVHAEGAAMFLPVPDWDLDDYSFHAPVKSVTGFSDWLGQDGWRVRATVMRFGDEDAELDILITRRAWSGDAPPQVGQDIEGRLWLQGRLWMPRSPKAKVAARRV